MTFRARIAVLAVAAIAPGFGPGLASPAVPKTLPYAKCREARGLEPLTATPSERERRRCRVNAIRHGRVDVRVAIRLIFPRRAWRDGDCVTLRENGWERHQWLGPRDIGAAGEVGPWQAHPHWFLSWERDRLMRDGMYATRFAVWLWRSSGGSFRVHWPRTAALCGAE